MTLSKDEILRAHDIKVQKLVIPEWEGEIYVKGLTGAERDAFEASVIEMKGDKTTVKMENIRAKLAAMCICDEKGERLFNDEEVLMLARKSASALQRIFDVAQRLSGLVAGDVESLIKN